MLIELNLHREEALPQLYLIESSARRLSCQILLWTSYLWRSPIGLTGHWTAQQTPSCAYTYEAKADAPPYTHCFSLCLNMGAAESYIAATYGEDTVIVRRVECAHYDVSLTEFHQFNDIAHELSVVESHLGPPQTLSSRFQGLDGYSK